MLTARLKAIYRFVVFHTRTTEFIAYSDAARETSGYNGWYEIQDRVVAFQRDDGTVQYVW